MIRRSTVIDEFRQESGRQESGRHALAYFYCFYGEEARKSPASILRALVKQLCLVDHGVLPEPVLSEYTKRQSQGKLSGDIHPNDSMNLIIALSAAYPQTTIVVDALDECEEDTRETLIGILMQIVQSASRIRILITSRNHEDIRRMLGNFPSHFLEATDNIGDIKLYIRSELERCSRRKAILDDPELRDEIIAILEDGAGGM